MRTDIATVSEVPEPEFLIILMITGVVFAVGAVITYFAVRSLRGKNPSKLERVVSFVPLGCGTIVFAPFALLLASWISYWVLPQHITTQAEVVRHYRGSIYGAHETLEVRADGSFTQTVEPPFGGTYKNEGTWKLEGNFVVLDNYLMFYDNEHNKLAVQPRSMSYVMYRYFYGDKTLINDWGSDHYILKGP